MTDTPDLTVRVLDDRDIVVVMAGTGFEVTYRKDGKLPECSSPPTSSAEV